MFYLAPDGGFSTVFQTVIVDSLIGFFDPVLRRSLDNPEVHMGKALISFDFFALFHAEIPRIPIHDVIVFAQQFLRLANVMNVGGRGCDGVNITRSSIYAGMDFHPMVPLIALARLMHFGIPCIGCILRRSLARR